MKAKIIEIEMTAQEMKASKSFGSALLDRLADALYIEESEEEIEGEEGVE